MLYFFHKRFQLLWKYLLPTNNSDRCSCRFVWGTDPGFQNKFKWNFHLTSSKLPSTSGSNCSQSIKAMTFTHLANHMLESLCPQLLKKSTMRIRQQLLKSTWLEWELEMDSCRPKTAQFMQTFFTMWVLKPAFFTFSYDYYLIWRQALLMR